MNVELSYDKEFSDLLNNLKDKYGAAIFELEGIGSQLDLNKFSKEFFGTKVTADTSIDANANVGDSTVVSYSVELTKPYEKLNSLYLLWKEMRRLYHTDIANKIIEMHISGDIYIHDLHSVNKPYCFNYSTYDIMNKGLPMITKIKSVEPKHLYSFKSQLEQFVVIASNSTLGATGIADVLIVMSYYVKNILASLEDAHFTFKDETAVWTYVKETITSLVYTLNQPFRGGIQCVTESTEILTPNGFKKYTELSVGDMVATFDIESQTINYQPIIKLNVSKYKGEIHCYGNQHVTPNHRVLLSHGGKYIFEYSENIAYELVGIPHIRKSIIEDPSYLIYNVMKTCMQYDGVVWCPTTDAGVVVFRNNNDVFISGNSAFTNVSVFDKSFLEDLSLMYIFPDGSSPDAEIVKRLQDIYVDVMNEILERTSATFPVTTAACAIDDERMFKNPDDVKHFIQQNLQFGFMNFYSGKSTTLSSCCRLRSDMESIGYSNSIGGSSTKIGSVGVTTINMYRLAVRVNGDVNKFIELLKHTVGAAARVNHARRTIIRKKSERGFAPLYTHEFISLDKQFSTCGINGFYEAMCALGIDITSDDGLQQAINIIDVVNVENKKYDKAFGYSHNCEQVPAESASVKIAQKDRLLGYNKEYELYSNQFIPLTASADILERIKIQGALDNHFSGGSILHLNFDQRIDDVDKIYNILQDAVLQGVVYMAINYVLNECENGHMSVGNMDICPVCGGELCNKFSRVVGFLSNVKNWNKVRRTFDFPNRKFYEVIK